MKHSTKTSTLLKNGGVAVIPTDTIYGIVARAEDERAVERVYEIRRRRPDKPCIILIADVADLSCFGIAVDQLTNQLINRLWPGPVSIILPCDGEQFSYLHRGTYALAFRLPAHEDLRVLLREAGPLIAPSANPEGQEPAATIDKARGYFGDLVDAYEDGGPMSSSPSTLIEIKNGKVVVLRQGVGQIPSDLL